MSTVIGTVLVLVKLLGSPYWDHGDHPPGQLESTWDVPYGSIEGPGRCSKTCVHSFIADAMWCFARDELLTQCTCSGLMMS